MDALKRISGILTIALALPAVTGCGTTSSGQNAAPRQPAPSSYEIDWQDKWQKSENWRIEIERIKDQEIKELESQTDNLMAIIGLLQREKESMDKIIDEKNEIIEMQEDNKQKLQDQIAVSQSLLERAQQQLNVEIATVERLMELVDEYRARAESAVARAVKAEQEVKELEGDVEKNRKTLAELEERVKSISEQKGKKANEKGKKQ